MIDARTLASDPEPLTAMEAAEVVREARDALNTVTVRLRAAGFDTGNHKPGTISALLLDAWSLLHNAAPMIAALDA